MQKRNNKDESEGKSGIAGMFKGLSDMIERLGELAEQGEELRHSGSSEGKSATGKPLSGVYGFSVKFGGAGGDGLKVEPFGHTRAANRQAGEASKGAGGSKAEAAERAAAVHEVREPMVDMFEEADGCHIVAEMPGIAASDVQLEFNDDILVLKADTKEKKYRKELLLPRAYSREGATIHCNNGIVEIRLK